MRSWQVIHGDSADVLKGISGASIDALVTDPPAGIAFMGKAWDRDKGGRDAWVSWLAGIMGEALRTMKPGAHGLVWALPRTSHWTATALELAGFEVRDRIAHLFSTGFPKSVNLGEGRGTALKPACEDWWLVRRPLAGTLAQTAVAFGTGAINIDACRIPTDAGDDIAAKNPHTVGVRGGESGIYNPSDPYPWRAHDCGRWPANIVLSHDDACTEEVCASGCAVAELDRQSGDSVSTVVGEERAGVPLDTHGDGWGFKRAAGGYTDAGGASRFFYVPKPPRSERERGCRHLPAKSGAVAVGREEGSAGLANPRAGAGRTAKAVRNHHPTVKATALMQWLCRLVTPPGGRILDPFCGSGSTGVAALEEGFDFIGVEQSAEYVEIARARLAAAQPHQLDLLGGAA